ncbi:uncharacterized protein EV154DRAFT_558626 [Mucor mucedo]|uniref:uncharacterized protein n=1 Tax=Mucor mucedo TaxID=29922 RepID=UPI0022210C92|nr:uncharacterized protein EV154DRAFT_558626 [Mucor mucedo]KAI7896287.1 hypothetical protein EV154DRAFT_558626 [Mucor mucedo]
MKKCCGFARVTHEHKYRVVESPQQGTHCGYDWYGGTDAPALKIPDKGIAVEGLTRLK